MNEGQSPAYAPGYQQTNVYATASLILGILGLFTCVTAPIGLVLGIVALVQIGRDPSMKGSGFAIAGLILSGLALLMVPILAAILFPVFARARAAGQESSCLGNVKQVSMAMRAYQADWDDTCPTANNWQASLEPFTKNSALFICPADKSGKPGYAMNEKMSAMPESAMLNGPDTVMIYECTPGDNKAGGAELLPSKPRHLNRHVVGFGDGHVTKVDQSNIGSLIWNPAKPGSGTQ